MAFAGNFADFSLPELLQFLDQGKKTGILYVESLPNTIEDNKVSAYYFWLHQGRVIAAANRLDQKGLTFIIDKRGWISERVISRVTQISSHSINTPLGLVLKLQGLLQPEQLKMLFNVQIIRPICNLLASKNGVFKFNQIETLPLPLSEMTGLSMTANEVALTSLRLLRDWSALAAKLPSPTSHLSTLSTKQPQFQLKSQEWQVWEFVNGHVSIQEIANQIQLPVEIVQQIAYRLIIVGLITENSMAATDTLATDTMTEEEVSEANMKASDNQSFLKNLVEFLRSKP